MLRKLLLILICFSLLLGNVFAASDAITNMDAQITVDSNGVCRVTVLAEVRFVNRVTTFLFPLGVDARDITASGASYNTKTVDDVKCVVFENESGFSGTQTFQCSYTLPCTMREISSGQRFTAKLPERGWGYPINRFKLTIFFPTEVTAFPRWQSAYYGDVIDNYLTIQVKENTVTAKSNIIFRDHETLTMDLDFQPNVFTLKHLAEKTVGIDRTIFLILYFICIVYWLFALRTPRGKKQKSPVSLFQYSAGEIPCQLFGEKADIGALIAHWGNLGYVILRRTKSGRFRLEKQMDMENERSAAERRVFRSVFRSSSVVEVPGVRFLSSVNAEAPVLRAHWGNRMFQKKDGGPKLFLYLCLAVGFCFSLMLFDTLLSSTPGRWIWIILLTLLSLPLYRILQQVIPYWYSPNRWIYVGLGLGIAVILFLFASLAGCGGYLFFLILLQLVAGYATRFGGQRTVPGQEMVLEIQSFLRSIARSKPGTAKEMVHRDSQYFYRALPYAEMLGAGNRFRKQFGAVTTDSCPWLIDERKSIRSPQDFYDLYKEFLRLIRSENRGKYLRFIAKNLDLSLPRIRPGTGSGSSRNTSSYKSHKRSTPYENSDYQRASKVNRNHSPRRTQHRANPSRTGRRS